MGYTLRILEEKVAFQQVLDLEIWENRKENPKG